MKTSIKMLALFAAYAGLAHAQAGNFTSITDTGTLNIGNPAAANPDTLVFDANVNNPGGTGSAPLLLTPYFSDANNRTVGEFCGPNPNSWANLTTGITTRYFACYNMKMGDYGSPIPAGTRGVPTGYQANIDTNQTPSDMAGSADGAMGYGSTITTRNGASFVSNAAAVNIQGPPAFGFGFDVGINNNATNGGGTQFGFYAGSWGPYPATYAFYLDGNWTSGMALNGHNVSGITTISFSAPASGIAHGTATPYAIVGSSPDTLRIYGGGTAGGMILTGSASSGGGLVRFRANPSSGTNAASVDTSTGNIAASALILTAPNGTCWKLSVNNSGALSTVSVACQI